MLVNKARKRQDTNKQAIYDKAQIQPRLGFLNLWSSKQFLVLARINFSTNGDKMKVKIKKLHPDAIIPKYAKSGDAGLDMHAIERGEVDDYGNMVYRTGLALEIPEGYVGLIFPRSSISKTHHMLRNHVGVVDSGYRGEIIFKFGWFMQAKTPNSVLYDKGDRIGQIMLLPYPKVEFIEVGELSNSDRGSGGFGSTGQ